MTKAHVWKISLVNEVNSEVETLCPYILRYKEHWHFLVRMFIKKKQGKMKVYKRKELKTYRFLSLGIPTIRKTSG